MGAVAWVGFAITIGGIGIALRQIVRARKAAVAAATAVRQLSAVIHSRERLLDVSSALRYLDSARHNIAQRDYSKAIIFLEFARNACVEIRELAAEDAAEKRNIGNIIVRITRLIEAATVDEAGGKEDDTAIRHGLEARGIADNLSAILAQLRYRYPENGSEK
jgi:hypothetical protein